MWKRMFLILLCKGILEEPKLYPPFSVFRVSVPSQVVMAAANPHTLRSPSCRPLRNPLTWTMGTQNPTTATAMGMGMVPGTLSITTQQVFMPTMAVMGTDPCQARWEALASVLHTGEGGTFYLIFNILKISFKSFLLFVVIFPKIHSEQVMRLNFLAPVRPDFRKDTQK